MPSNQRNLLLTMVQVLYLLEVFILAHYGSLSTETPTTTIVRYHNNSWIYLTSTYYWWLLRPTITIRFEISNNSSTIRFDSKWKKHYSHSTNNVCTWQLVTVFCCQCRITCCWISRRISKLSWRCVTRASPSCWSRRLTGKTSSCWFLWYHFSRSSASLSRTKTTWCVCCNVYDQSLGLSDTSAVGCSTLLPWL